MKMSEIIEAALKAAGNIPLECIDIEGITKYGPIGPIRMLYDILDGTRARVLHGDTVYSREKPWRITVLRPCNAESLLM
jgi:hypothetical protein